ncbi:MAG TPA: cation-translocating P-type ATPase C-terminal domain-containing protein, partial [Chloroflexota bacterium]|nr:cation-translocating P-type ATPase C-terminal domain-containing protein [Chloroflexota bacterium]
NFAITVPIAIALGFDKPSPGLMERKPRPLQQPVLSRAQWMRIVLLGVVMAAGTLLVEAYFGSVSAVLAASMGATVFSLYNIFAGLSSRDETQTAVSRDLLADRRQVGLYGLALLLTILATELGVLQRILGTTSLSGDQWLLAIAVAATVLVVDEVIKFVLRRRRSAAPVPAAAAVPAAPVPA